ncbi:tensin-1-like isoform X7 [Ceratina calcarata]|uniref:Tensin-1-like isoform X7 n=1 Tax=Ceratina calcarata TaxID=156304 RepID=A0AAJ7RVV4_9HYME|nr:tensin-1-like isoform X7 [Ceratina calcarata]
MHAALRCTWVRFLWRFPILPAVPSTCVPNWRFSDDRSTPVLLIVSLAGIKVCSPDGKCVQMAHALRRISYATCEPQHAQFSFLAREPRAHFSIQYCHSFITESAEQAEELNTIVGNAFRMAYVAQLQRQPILQDVIAPQSSPPYRKDKQENRSSWNKSLSGDGSIAGAGGVCRNSSSNSWLKSRTSPTSRTGSGSSAADMNVQLGSAGSPTLRLASVKQTPNSIPGLRPTHNFTNVLGPITNEDEPKSISQQSTPSSDESNSPTELNSYKRLTDKPPLIKRLAMGLTGGRDVLGLNGEDDSCPLVSGSSTPTSPSNRPHSGGYINEAIIDSEGTRSNYNKIPPSESLDNTINASITAKNFNIENNRIGHNSPSSGTETEFKSKRRSQISTSSSSVPADGSTHGSTPTPPPLPERTDSLNNRSEEAELRKAPWFQAGIPREITLEVLSQEPEGAFMVRESTSKPGCYALSLRVPREFQPSGIAHYLIMRTNKGYKIKGFTKEFTTLTALITHHSVMPELLPCPLSLSRYNPSFVKSDSNKDFADIDSDPDYNTLADFRKMMADLNV